MVGCSATAYRGCVLCPVVLLECHERPDIYRQPDARKLGLDVRGIGRGLHDFLAADVEEPLRPPDLESAAKTAQLLGRQPDAVKLWTRAIRGWEVSGDNERAAIGAHWLAMSLMQRGETARRLVGPGQRVSRRMKARLARLLPPPTCCYAGRKSALPG